MLEEERHPIEGVYRDMVSSDLDQRFLLRPNIFKESTLVLSQKRILCCKG